MSTVFCDFDGTITVEETFVSVLKHFAPELSEEEPEAPSPAVSGSPSEQESPAAE